MYALYVIYIGIFSIKTCGIAMLKECTVAIIVGSYLFLTCFLKVFGVGPSLSVALHMKADRVYFGQYLMNNFTLRL